MAVAETVSEVTIQSSQVDADLTDFPVYLRGSDFNDEFWDDYLESYRFEHMESTTLLCAYEGETGATTPGLKDRSGQATTSTISNFNTAGLATTQTREGQITSLGLDGNSDWLKYVRAGVSYIGSGDFTIECAFYPTSFALVSGNNRCLFSATTAAVGASLPCLLFDTSGFMLWYDTTTRITASSACTLNAWNTVRIERSGTTTTMYLNGSSVGSYTDSNNWSSQQFNIGSSHGSTATGFFSGYIDYIRVTKGVALGADETVFPIVGMSEGLHGHLKAFNSSDAECPVEKVDIVPGYRTFTTVTDKITFTAMTNTETTWEAEFVFGINDTTYQGLMGLASSNNDRVRIRHNTTSNKDQFFFRSAGTDHDFYWDQDTFSLDIDLIHRVNLVSDGTNVYAYLNGVPSENNPIASASVKFEDFDRFGQSNADDAAGVRLYRFRYWGSKDRTSLKYDWNFAKYGALASDTLTNEGSVGGTATATSGTDQTAPSAEIHALYDGTVSSSSNTVMQIAFQQEGHERVAAAPLSTHATWAAYEFVSHDGGLTDSTGNYTPSNTGAATATGILGDDAVEFNETGSSRIEASSFDSIYVGGGTVSAWVNADSDGEGTFGRVFEINDTSGPGDENPGSLYVRNQSGSSIDFRFSNLHTTTWAWDVTGKAINTDYLIHVDYNSTTHAAPNIYFDGALAAETWVATGSGTDGGGPYKLIIGNRAAYDREWDGVIDEVRAHTSALSAQWIDAEYTNQKTPTTFYSIAAPSVGGGFEPAWASRSNQLL